MGHFSDMDIARQEERQILMARLQILAGGLKPQYRHRMMLIILKLWKLIEKVEADDAVIDNAVLYQMIGKLQEIQPSRQNGDHGNG